MYASHEGHLEVVELLIEAEADVNAQANNGYTALKYALENGHTEVAQILRRSGAK